MTALHVLFDNGFRADSFGFDNVDTAKFRSAEFANWNECVEYALGWLQDMRNREVDYVTLSSEFLVNGRYYYAPGRCLSLKTYEV